MQSRLFFILSVFLFVVGCTRSPKTEVTPWGTTIGQPDSIEGGDTRFSLDDIMAGGEMIMLTMSGPDSYYDYRGRGMGTQYLMCERFAQKLGVSLRVEVCKDTAEMVRRLNSGDGDIIAFQMPRSVGGVLHAGACTDSTSWAVRTDCQPLADSLRAWYTPNVLAKVKQEERLMMAGGGVKRHVYAPILNASKGQISSYDQYFRLYAPTARWDWRLMAAQCYQESAFDPHARSWAGARGLMQIMPSTAASLGLAEADIFSPGPNIEAAARYIARLNGLFADVRSHDERINFVLASYNGGHFHVRDAMALARKHGRNPYRWSDVAHEVLALSTPAGYNDPVVKYGYMRGSETVEYVARIRDRWAKYRSAVGMRSMESFSGRYDVDVPKPHSTHRKKKYQL